MDPSPTVEARPVHPFPPARLLMAASGGAAALFLMLWWTIERGTTRADAAVEAYMAANMSAGERDLWGAVFSFPGDLWPLLVVLAAGAAACVYFKRIMNPLWMAGYTLVIVLLTSELKDLIARARPLDNGLETHAFPSGHAARAVLVYGLVFAFVLEAWHARARDGLTRPIPAWVPPAALGAWAMVAFVVGAGRVFEGSHWVTDVLAGWALGFAVLGSAMLYHGQIQRRVRTLPRRPATAPARQE